MKIKLYTLLFILLICCNFVYAAENPLYSFQYDSNGNLKYNSGSVDENFGRAFAFSLSPTTTLTSENLGAINKITENKADSFGFREGISSSDLKNAKSQLLNYILGRANSPELVSQVEVLKKLTDFGRRNIKDGVIELDSKYSVSLKKSSSTNFLQIPYGYDINYQISDIGKIEIKRNPYYSPDLIKLGDLDKNTFDLSKGASLILNFEDNKLMDFEIKGDGSFKNNFLDYPGVRDAKVRFKDEEIIYAEFMSVNGGSYKFKFNGKEFLMGSRAKGKLLFNPLDGKISGSNGDLAFQSRSGSSRRSIIDSTGAFTANIDKDGKVISIDLDKQGKFIDFDGNVYGSPVDFKIYLDGRDIRGEKNAVSIPSDGSPKIALKGQVEVTSGELHYIGGEKAYTIFDSSSNNDYKKKSFEVLEGNAQIDNGKAKILVKNGEILLERLKKIEGVGEDFLVKTKSSDNKDIFADIYSSNGDFSVSIKSFVDGKETSVKVIDLSKVSEMMSISNFLRNEENVLLERAQIKAKIEELQDLWAQIAFENVDPDINARIDAIELEIINNQNKLDGDVDKSIARIRDYLRLEDLEDNSRQAAQMRLAELLSDKATTSLKSFEDIGVTEEYSSRSAREASVSSRYRQYKLGYNQNGEIVVKGYVGDFGNFFPQEESLDSFYARLFSTSNDRKISISVGNQDSSLEEIQSVLNKYKDISFGSEAVDLYRSLIKESKGVNDNVFVAANYGLANAYKSSENYVLALMEFKRISESSDFSNEVKSEAMRQAAIIAVETGSRSDALKYLQQSLAISSDNLASKELERNIEMNYFRQMISRMGQESTEAYQGLLDRLGWVSAIKREMSPARSNSDLLKSVNYATTNLDEQQMGAFAYLYAMDRGLDSSQFSNMDREGRRAALSEYFVSKGMDPAVDERFLDRLVRGSFELDKNRDLDFMKDPKSFSGGLALENPGTKYMTKVFSLTDDMLVYANPIDAAMLVLPFAPLKLGKFSSLGGRLGEVGETLSLGNYLGRASNFATLGGLGLARTTTAEILGSEILADLGLSVGTVYGTSQIPGPVGEILSEAAAMVSFERIGTEIAKKIIGAEIAGALRKESGELVPLIRVAGKEADEVAKDMAKNGYRMMELESGEKVFVHSSVKDEKVLTYFSREELQTRASLAAREGNQELVAASNAEISSAAATGCFLAGTAIMLGNGNYKNIEDIKTGENVKAFDLVNNKAVDASVTMTFVRKSQGYRIIKYEIEK